MLQIITDGFLSPPAAGVAACHRLAVFDFGAQGQAETPLEATTQPIRILAVVSQSDVVRWLAAHTPSLGDLPRATLSDLQLLPKPVCCVGADDPAVEAFQAILAAGLPAAGVHNGAGHDAIVGALNLADLKGIVAEKLGVLALPVGEFLAVRFATVWASAHGMGVEAGGLARRDTLLQQHTLVRAAPHDTFGQLLRLFVSKHARAVCVLDDHSKPLSVVTPTDIMRVITDEAGPTKGALQLAPPV